MVELYFREINTFYWHYFLIPCNDPNHFGEISEHEITFDGECLKYKHKANLFRIIWIIFY
jgi:hypothetical protein